MVAMKNDARPTCVGVFNEVIEVAVGLIKETIVHLVAQKQEEVFEGQTRHGDAIFKHINLSLLQELTHFLDRFYKRHYLQIAVPHEKIF